MENKNNNNPSIFLTDYASYNEGTQFEFGHWIDLTDFNDSDELNKYITNHFKKADKKSPIDSYGTEREEIMITDYENFPKSLYCESGGNFDNIFEWIDLCTEEELAVEFLLEQGLSFEEAMEKKENVNSYLNNSNSDLYEIVESYYPDAYNSENDYMTFDEERFVKDCFTEFEFEGDNYLICDSWNH
tara:strand:+ start:832 stop:1392 length:561 start_codon:yes stop_codon:yes gene_type:complete